MPTAALQVLYEDNHLLLVNKPAGLPTMGVAAGHESLVETAKTYLREKYGKPGNVYLGVVSRLDAAVTGVIVLARTSKAASRLAEQFRDGQVDKLYWALVEGRPDPASAICIDRIRKDDRRQRMYVTQQQHPDARLARLRYCSLACLDRATLLEVRLESGRKHQIRLQLAHRGHPVLGDAKYGATTTFPDGIALHARQLAFTHPVRKSQLYFSAPPPESWRHYGVKEHYECGDDRLMHDP